MLSKALSDEIWLEIKGEAEDELFGAVLLPLPTAPVSPGSLQRLLRGGEEKREIAFKASDSWLLTGGGRRGYVSNYLCRWGQIPGERG